MASKWLHTKVVNAKQIVAGIERGPVMPAVVAVH